MSFYRNFNRERSDGHEPEEEERCLELAHPPAASQISLEADRYQPLRKSAPVNKAFQRTLTWANSLPDDIRPIAVLRRYPRIANLIVAVWADRKCFHAYMESLLTDRRGGRRGFPPDVLAELISLKRYHDTLEPASLRCDATGKRA